MSNEAYVVVENTGMTFNQWIAAFRKAVPGGIPILTKFLQDQSPHDGHKR